MTSKVIDICKKASKEILNIYNGDNFNIDIRHLAKLKIC